MGTRRPGSFWRAGEGPGPLLALGFLSPCGWDTGRYRADQQPSRERGWRRGPPAPSQARRTLPELGRAGAPRLCASPSQPLRDGHAVEQRLWVGVPTAPLPAAPPRAPPPPRSPGPSQGPSRPRTLVLRLQRRVTPPATSGWPPGTAALLPQRGRGAPAAPREEGALNSHGPRDGSFPEHLLCAGPVRRPRLWN